MLHRLLPAVGVTVGFVNRLAVFLYVLSSVLTSEFFSPLRRTVSAKWLTELRVGSRFILSLRRRAIKPPPLDSPAVRGRETDFGNVSRSSTVEKHRARRVVKEFHGKWSQTL